MSTTHGVLLPLAILAGLLSTAHATSIYSTDFTSGSYADGSINGQDGWAAAGGGTVISGTGVTSDGYENIVQSASSPASMVAVGETYTSSVTFTYDDNSAGVGNGPHYGAAIYSGTDPSDSQLNMLVRRTGDSYRLTLSSDWGGSYGGFGFNQSPTFADTTLGFDHDMSDPNSDVLTMSLSLTAGADTDSWTAVGTLYNETTMSQVYQVTLNDIPFDAAAGSTVYGGFGGGQSDNNQTIANRTASAYSFSSTVSEVPEPSTSIILLSIGLALAHRR
ncbi:hypothetical protein MalM25_22260 [Planctomycetes bacterium MalM25]|nr:hypothetical protein MalM25_22260 [Planctomycetes bacterium MalM25]